MQKGTLSHIAENSDSSSSDSEEDSPLSHKNFPPHDPTALRAPPAVPLKMAISGDFVPGVRPHAKSPFSVITNPIHSEFDTTDSSS